MVSKETRQRLTRCGGQGPLSGGDTETWSESTDTASEDGRPASGQRREREPSSQEGNGLT